MSGVLKKHGAVNAPVVHSLAAAWRASEAGNGGAETLAVDPERMALEEELRTLRQRLAQQEAQASDLRDEAQSAFEKGEARGREAGLREAADQEALRLARLETGIEHAQATFKQALAGLEHLAPALAEAGLAAVLGSPDDRASLVSAIIRQRLKALETRSIMHIEVSAADFADDQALDALGGTLGSLGPLVQTSVALKSGACRIRLKLGTLDVGLDQQWRRLGALLQEMAEPAGREV